MPPTASSSAGAASRELCLSRSTAPVVPVRAPWPPGSPVGWAIPMSSAWTTSHNPVCPAGSIVIVEGVSSTRTELGDCWDLTVWVDTPRAIRLVRGIRRDGEARRSQWTQVWMPEEDAYIAAQHPEQRADLIFFGSCH